MGGTAEGEGEQRAEVTVEQVWLSLTTSGEVVRREQIQEGIGSVGLVQIPPAGCLGTCVAHRSCRLPVSSPISSPFWLVAHSSRDEHHEGLSNTLTCR